MRHFVSASCTGEKCRCGKPATHKLGEEIPQDEPCPQCGTTWKAAPLPAEPRCDSFYHRGWPIRHNLTSYVCCACFTRIVGFAADCPLTERERHAHMVYAVTHEEELGMGPPLPIVCPRCDGELEVEGMNKMDTLAFVSCKECRTCFQLPRVVK